MTDLTFWIVTHQAAAAGIVLAVGALFCVVCIAFRRGRMGGE